MLPPPPRPLEAAAWQLLKVLGQNPDFDSLHWFTSIEEHYRQHLEDLAVDQRRSKREPPRVDWVINRLGLSQCCSFFVFN